MRLLTVAAAVLAAGGLAVVGLTTTETRALEEKIAHTQSGGWKTTHYSKYSDWEIHLRDPCARHRRCLDFNKSRS